MTSTGWQVPRGAGRRSGIVLMRLRSCHLLSIIAFAVAAIATAVSSKEGQLPAVALQGHTADLAGASFSPDGSKVVTASSDKTARIWDAKTGAVLHELSGHAESVRTAQFSPDGTRVITASRDGTARIWNVATGGVERTLAGHGEMLESAVTSR